MQGDRGLSWSLREGSSPLRENPKYRNCVSVFVFEAMVGKRNMDGYKTGTQ